MRNLLYLVNPISGTSKKEVLVKMIEAKTRQQGLPFQVVFTTANGHYDYLRDKIRNEKITDIILVGGDGTINQVVGELRDEDVNFGIIPTGSGNGLALSAGISRTVSKALSVVFNGKASYIDAFTINEQFSCMLSGLGFDAHVAHEFASKASRGLFTYTQQSLVHYFKAHPYQFEIQLKDFCFYTEAFLISVANSNQFGNNFTIAPQASLNDGLLDIVIIQKMNKARLPFAVLKQIRGNNKLQELVEDLTHKNIIYFQTPALTIRNIKLAPFHIDGEPKETHAEYKIEVIPNCFRLIQP